MPENLPDVEALMPLGLLTLLAISPVVSLLTSPVAVNPVKVFVMPSNSVEPERPITLALALFIEAETSPPLSV